MGYEKEVLARARQRHAADVEAQRQEKRWRKEGVYAQCPQVKQLDLEIRLTMADVMAHAFRYGEDPQEALARIRDKNLNLQQKRNQLLYAAGYTPEQIDDGPVCRKCSDTGYLGEKMCACFERYCIEEQKKELTSLLSCDKTFDDFDLDYYPDVFDPALRTSPRKTMETIYEACIDYSRHFSPKRSPNLLFCGGTGLGKTFLSACIAQEVVARGYSVVYDTAIHVFACMEKQKFGGASEEELRMVQRIMVCDLLILDDLGTEMPTSFTSSALYNIINSRIMERAPMIISSNSNIDQLAQRYTPQIESRLRGEFQLLNFLGQDIRRLKKMRA